MTTLARALPLAIVALATVGATNAAAAQRYAAPGASSAGSCPASDPCTIQRAVNNAGSGDEVIVAPGDYNVASNADCMGPPGIDDQAALHATAGMMSVHGVDGQPRPRIVGSSSTCITAYAAPGAELRNLSVRGGANPVLLEGYAGGLDADKVQVQGSGTLTNSVVTGDVIGFNGSPVVRGVTANAFRATGFNAAGPVTVAMTVRNSIARATSNAVVAEIVGGAGTATATLDIDYSNYHAGAVNDPPGASASVVQGTHNQNADMQAPVFVDAPNGNFHEVAGSPTINAGEANASNGTQDLDGGARAVGTPDIGADEFGTARPVVTTGAASSVSTTAGTLSGTANPLGVATTVRFEYGPSSAYGNETAVQNAGQGYGDVPATATLSGLVPGGTYHYRTVATNGVITSVGPDRTFTTATDTTIGPGPGPGPGPEPGPEPGPGPGPTPPVVVPPATRSLAVPQGQKIGRVLKNGLQLTVISDEPGSAAATVTLDRKVAKRLKLRGGAGSGKAGVPTAGQPVTLKVRLAKLSKKQVNALGKLKSLKLTVTVKLTDASGRAATLTKTLTLKK